MKPTLASFKRNQLWHAVCVGSLTSTWLIASSVVQASDLQIYAVPEAGKKTIVMMLDTSGSMAYYDDCERTKTATHRESVVIGGVSQTISYERTNKSEFYPGNDSKKQYVRCSSGFNGYSRLSRLQDGMFALLNSTNSDLPNVSVGLGNYSSGGDGKTGQIVIPAKPLGAPGSDQRNALKKAIAGLTSAGNTPTAQAYAEAASYLMGTTTYKDVAVVWEKYQRRVSGKSTEYRTCGTIATNLTTMLTAGCSNNGWNAWTSVKPSGIKDVNNYVRTSSDRNYTYYYYTEAAVENLSGIGYSRLKDTATNPDIVISRTSTNANAQYKTPLPDPEDRQSCDGQGVYVLSDGEANASGTEGAKSVMQTALTDAYSSGFECDDTLIDANDNSSNSAMNCMANFAKKLFNPNTNPTGVSIKTAFVGFGGDMSNLNDWHVKSSCQWSSRAYNDPVEKTAPDDKCSPGSGVLAVPGPTSQTSFDGGYGNGGFFIASTDTEVTNSVIQFIRNLGAAPLEPLTTGTIAVPYDSLDPKSLETTGYLRAMEPNPASPSLTWRGNLKKYESILTGTNAGAFGDKGGSLVYDSTGNFEEETKDYWNGAVKVSGTSYSYNDGGNIEIGGVRWNMPMPALGQSEEKRDGEVIKYTYSSSGSVRNFYTDAGAYDSTKGTVAAILGSKTGAALLKIPTSPTAGYGTTPETSASHILAQFGSDTVIKDYPALLKRKLLNYLGFNLQLTADALPATLTAPDAPYFSMGGIIHSYPVQLTYSGTLDENGDLSTTRERSILFGTMEGGLHIVNAKTGVEESVFVPAEILNDAVKSKALSPVESDAVAPSHGMDGAWVADPAYKMDSTKSGTTITTKVTARRMNVYGGMRMGGNSYFGMDVLDPKKPKLLFRINKDTTGFSDMGQSWSKPVLANVRYGSEIKRVMIIGGGYDQCYENPSFKLGASGLTYPDSCNGKTTAKGNAVYIVDAEDGSLVWSATYNANAADADGAKYLKHSIVSRISTLDRDADGLIDHLYFGDLGGQIFRIDLDNKATAKANLGKRVVRLANLASAVTDAGYKATSTKTYLDENAPRFYEPVTVTIHDQAAKTFILVGAASGDRSTPLDVSPLTGREGMLPGTALSTKPVNNAYGIIDNDFMTKDLITGSPTLTTVNKTMDDLVRNPQVLPEDVTSVISRFFNSNGEAVKHGWYRSLSSVFDGTEKANNTFRREGGMKAFEEPMALTGHLMVSVYDPEGTGVSSNDPCNPRIVGETDWQKFCLPFGACINSDGSINSSKEKNTGSQWDKDGKNSNILGSGIRGITLVGTGGGGSGSGQCGRITMAGNVKGTGVWQCTSHFIPTRWYERYR